MKLDLAFGLTGISDSSAQFPFLDLMKSGRPWLKEGWLDPNPYSEIEPYLDANGWPTQLPPGWSLYRNSWALPEGDPHSAGPFVLTYDGEGTIAIGDVSITHSEAGRIEFTNTGEGVFWIDISATDPNETGEYIRNIRIVPAEHEALADSGEIFHPDFLASLEGLQEIRFMDWMHTNGSSIVDFADFPTKDFYTYQGSGYGAPTFGVPVEVMVELANRIGANPWFNMPHLASDSCVGEFAEYVRDNLAPGLVASVEYSNEMWNWASAFTQTPWAVAQAEALWGTDPVAGDTPKNFDYQAMRATQIAKIWDDVFVGQEDRVYHVLGLQTADQGWWADNRMLPRVVWETKNDPLPVLDPLAYFDAIAVTSYFGGEVLTNTTRRDELVAYLETHTTEQTCEWLKDKLLNDETYGDSLPVVFGWWASLRTVANDNAIDLILYEGGQHFAQQYDTTGLDSDQIAALLEFQFDFVHSPQMGELYDALWDGWAQVGDGPFMHFVDVAKTSRFGAWGLRESLRDMNPRAACVMSRARGLPRREPCRGVTAKVA